MTMTRGLRDRLNLNAPCRNEAFLRHNTRTSFEGGGVGDATWLTTIAVSTPEKAAVFTLTSNLNRFGRVRYASDSLIEFLSGVPIAAPCLLMVRGECGVARTFASVVASHGLDLATIELHVRGGLQLVWDAPIAAGELLMVANRLVSETR